MVEPRAFIFLGSDELEKQKRIELLQKKLFPASLRDLNFSLFYADDKDFTCEALREALLSFATAGAKKRLVLIRMAHRMKSAPLACLRDTLAQASGNAVVILDVPGPSLGGPDAKQADVFVRGFKEGGVQVVAFKDEATPSVFDLGRAILGRRSEAALRILCGLLRSKEKAEKILGALFWQWERSRSERRLSEEAYKKGLKAILEADKRLKSASSAFARETLIMEALVVRLSCSVG